MRFAAEQGLDPPVQGGRARAAWVPGLVAQRAGHAACAQRVADHGLQALAILALLVLPAGQALGRRQD
jgi:hypothetical protein